MGNEEYTGGAGGKFRSKVLRTTPYDLPAIKNPNPNPNNTSELGFLSRLVYTVTCAFWKRNTGTNKEQRNTRASEHKGWNLANISAAEISDLETMLKQKTFTRLGEGDKANISNDSHVLRLKASTSGPLNKHSEKTKNFHAVISTPRAFEDDVALPVELAKARFHGTSAMYRMARVPYYKGPSTLSKKPILMHEVYYDYGPTPFRFFHYWFEVDGFDKFIKDSWKDAPIIESNALVRMMKNLST
nr:RNA-directed DNA polymerase, eukaryota, reverse transcriptase zinc-binding domain protein [Tanacetum cinerariifolium]